MTDVFSATVRIAPDVLHQELAGETVLLNLTNEHYFGLDAVGTRIWSVLSATGSPGAAVAAILDEFDVTEEQVRTDVARLIAELAEAGLLSVVSGDDRLV